VLYAQLRQGLAEATTPFGGAIPAGTPVVLVDARAAGLSGVVVVEGTTSSDLTNGPGHLSSTPLPGQAGVSVLMGRSVMFGAPFRHIGSMRAGDKIEVTTGQGQFTYRVDDVRHKGDPLPPPLAQGKSRLTLVSSVAAGWRGGWAPQQTVYVDASLAGGTVQPAPPGRPSLVPAAADPMQGDNSSLVSLVLWLQGLLIVAVLVVVGRQRWGRWQTWLLGMPLALACLWGATQAAVVLLPNLV
jgi:sortase A